LASLNPDHLLEQAEHLIERGTAGGEPRAVDLRRAISAAYYAVFHDVLAAAADEFVGPADRGTPRYTLVYRSIDHRVLSRLCAEVKKSKPSAQYQGYAPATGFTREARSFAGYVVELQEKRHSADYDPAARFTTADGQFAITTARRAIGRLAALHRDERQIFLALLLFPPR
jgi:hypothetical protein